MTDDTRRSASPRAEVVPSDMVLMPRAITEEMHIAACKVLHRAHGIDGLPQRMLDAMVAAAPQQAPARTAACRTCGESQPFTGSCGTSPNDTKALCHAARTAAMPNDGADELSGFASFPIPPARTAADAPADQHTRTLRELLVCCEAWEPDARVMGNVRSGDAADAIRAALATIPDAPSEEVLLNGLTRSETDATASVVGLASDAPYDWKTIALHYETALRHLAENANTTKDWQYARDALGSPAAATRPVAAPAAPSASEGVPGCARSHPHELMSEECKRKTEQARSASKAASEGVLGEPVAEILGEQKAPISPRKLPSPGPNHPGPWVTSDRGNGHADVYDAKGQYIAHVYLWDEKEAAALRSLVDASAKMWECAECSQPDCGWSGQCDGESCPSCGGHVVEQTATPAGEQAAPLVARRSKLERTIAGFEQLERSRAILATTEAPREPEAALVNPAAPSSLSAQGRAPCSEPRATGEGELPARAGDAVQQVRGFLCKAWGETELPEVRLVRTRAEWEEFVVDAQWGADTGYLQLDAEDRAMVDAQIRYIAHDMADNNEGQINFEIGGVSVERVTFALASPPAAPLQAEPHPDTKDAREAPCHCPCCREGIAAPHEYHLESRPMPTTTNALQAAILNLRCKAPDLRCRADVRLAYAKGHDDCRHAAAELVAAIGQAQGERHDG